MDFFSELKARNESLFWFGLICLIASAVFIVLAKTSSVQVAGVNAWYKPLKFALSTAAFSWAMAWYIHYLPNYNPGLFNISIIVLLSFEVIYIAVQAGRGQLSHFNLSTPVYSMLYSLMAIAATAVTVYAGYIGLLFFTKEVDLPAHYLWSIRAGIFIFVIFSLEGFVMGSRLSHTIGGADGNHGIAFLGWSRKFGDPRIAHFIGMHALQVLPLLSWYLLRNTKATLIVAVIYLLLAAFTLVKALQGKPMFGAKKADTEQS
jgi:hypothetical protein